MDVSREPFRVFVVEDDVSDARMLVQLLREDGYDVEVAFDGASAVSRLAQEPTPHMLIVDYKLPYVDGLAIASFARSRDAAIEVVVVTGYPDIVGRVACQAGGPLRAVLTKPLTYSDLTVQLERARASRVARSRGAG